MSGLVKILRKMMMCSDENEDDDVTICSKDQAALSPLAQAGSLPPETVDDEHRK